MRHRPKKDTNHDEIVLALRAAGATVQSLAAMGDGVPDLLVGYCGENFLFEVKTATGELTDDEAVWFDKWRGEVHIVRTIEDALITVCLPFE